MALRLDRIGKIDGVRKTPQGGLIAPANLTRTGIFVYPGSKTGERELRPASSVFHADSMASLRDAPLTTDVHPQRVDANNWRQLAVGHVVETHEDGIYLAGTVRINDGPTVSRVDNRELVELSCGYSCDLELTPGEYEGEHYDAIQTNISYNHVTVGPKDWGRAGNEVRLRTDADDANTYLEGTKLEKTTQSEVRADTSSKDSLMSDEVAKKPVETPAIVSTVDPLVAKLTADNEKLSAEVAQALADASEKALADATARNDALAAELAQIKADALKAAQATVLLATPTVAAVVHLDALDEARNRHDYHSRNAYRGKEWLAAHPYTPGTR